MKAAWFALWMTLAGAAASRAHAQPAPHAGAASSNQYEQARELFGQASEAYAKADYARARELFAKAHALEPGAATFRALGFCDFQLKQYAQAMTELHAALAETRSVKALARDQQREVAQMIKQINPFVGRVVLLTEPEHTDIQVDGHAVAEREFWLLKGEHTLLASAHGYRDQTVKLTIAGNDEQNRTLALAPITQPEAPAAVASAQQAAAEHTDTVASSTAPDLHHDSGAGDPAAAGRIRGIIGLGVGGAALVTGVVTGAISIVKTHDEKHHCSDGHCPRESRSALSTANTLANVANVTLVLGAAGIAYGLYELLTLPSTPTEHASQPGLHIAVTGTGIMLHGRM